MNLPNKMAIMRGERSLKGLRQKIFQVARRPGLVVPDVQDPIPEDCGRDLYDFYLTKRRGELCWRGENVFDTAQDVVDAMMDRYDETSIGGTANDRTITCWVDAAPTVLFEGGNFYGNVTIPDGRNLQGYFTAPGSGFQIEGWTTSFFGTWNVGNGFLQLDFKNMNFNGWVLNGSTIWLKFDYCNFTGDFDFGVGETFTDLAIEAKYSFLGDIFKGNAALGLQNHNLFICFIDHGFVGSIEANSAQLILTSNCFMDELVFNSLQDCRIFDGHHARDSVQGGETAWLHILDDYRRVALTGNHFNGARDWDALVNLDIPSGGGFRHKLLIGNNTIDFRGSGTPTDNYIVQKTGAGDARNVMVRGNSIYGLAASTQKGARGVYIDSVFGMNAPNDLDYSGVSGPGNVIWQ